MTTGKEIMIERAIGSASVRAARKSLNINEDATWNIFYNTGIEYLHHFKQRIKQRKVYNRVFKLVEGTEPFGSMYLRVVFESIEYSVEFWKWWSTQLWEVCHDGDFNDRSELEYRLQFNTQLIPSTVIQKIFSNGKKSVRSKRFKSKPGNQAANAKKQEIEA